MKREFKGTIFVNTFAQKALLEHELMGQFSDGLWENSRNKSWEFYNNCDIQITGEEIGFKDNGFHYPKAYKCNNTELLSYVGTRMLGVAKLASYLEREITYNEGYFAEWLVGCDNIDEYVGTSEEKITEVRESFLHLSKDGEEYWVRKLKEFDVFVKNIGVENLIEALSVDSPYNKVTLRKELREITEALKTNLA